MVKMPVIIKIKKTLYALSEMSNLIGVSTTVLRRDILTGKLKAVRNNRMYYIPADEVAKYAESMDFDVKLELNEDIEIIKE